MARKLEVVWSTSSKIFRLIREFVVIAIRIVRHIIDLNVDDCMSRAVQVVDGTCGAAFQDDLCSRPQND